eukprot:6189176-Pleurochrysis_carterae.AAC.1
MSFFILHPELPGCISCRIVLACATCKPCTSQLLCCQDLSARSSCPLACTCADVANKSVLLKAEQVYFMRRSPRRAILKLSLGWFPIALAVLPKLAAALECPSGSYVGTVRGIGGGGSVCLPCLCPYGDEPVGCGGDQPGTCETPSVFSLADEASSGSPQDPIIGDD